MSSELSPQQQRVLKLVAEGHTNRGIAREMGLSEKTVAEQRRRAMDRLGLVNRVELVRWALDNGLLR